MANLREDITRTVLRLSRRGDSAGSRAELEATVLKPDPREGKQVGNYRILKRLGTGGMGHVYLALDTRLGRHVALKFLAHQMMGDYSMLYRLQQEARTASALNHPNIVTVYEIGELAGEPFIASEFIDGATLRVALERKAVDVPTAVDVATQVASALVAAHAAGVVHRDLKPGNIMLRPDGYVKVIDFGLAKQIQKSAPGGSGEDFVTQPGSVLGTVSYMSPEQAQGDAVDHRTDLWSLGVVLYEMVAHRRPFDGQTDSHVIVSILDGRLPPLPDPKSVPAGLVHILECALAKDPHKRYPSASEMLTDLHQIGQGSRTGSSVRLAALSQRRQARRQKLVLPLVVLLGLLTAGAVWWWASRRPDWFQIGSVRQLTFNGRTRLATISPDGNYLAFVVGEAEGQQTLYLKQVDSSTEEIKIPARRIDYVGLTFSPDSRYLFETEKDETMVGKLYAMPILGTRPSVPLVDDIDGPVSFSPNADQFAFVRFTHLQHAGREHVKSAIFIASLDGEKHQILSLAEPAYQCIAWSPRADRIAAILFSDMPGRSGESILDLIDLKGRETRRPLPDWRLVGKPSWTPDSKTLILTAANRSQARSQLQIRQIAVASGKTHDITVGLAGYKAASVARNGAEIAATKLESRASVWVSAPNNFTTGQTFLAEAEQRPSITWPDASHLVLNSQRSGYPNLWLLDIGTHVGSSLTNAPYVQEDAASFPGGESIALASNRTGELKIWRFDRNTVSQSQLTFGPNYDEAPAVSPDGKWIVYTSSTGNLPHLRKIASTGGESIQIGSYPARDAQISPDGKWIACYAQSAGTASWGVVVLPFDGSGAPHPVLNAYVPLRWSPGGRALTSAITDANGVSNLWSVPLDGAEPRQLTHFDDELIPNFSWSPHGDRIACVRVRVGADVELFNRQDAR